MTLTEILSFPPADQIKALKSRRNTPTPDIEKIKACINPQLHSVFDKSKRPDKIIKNNDSTRTEPVARIGLALQKLIIKRAVSFLFGNPVQWTANPQTEQETQVFNALKEIANEVKINSHNRKLARELFSCTEVAELWYPLPISPNEAPKYGIGSQHKVRVKIFSPLLGDKLFPFFDDYGDLVAFSREFSVSNGNKKQTFFETYTDTQILKYDITEGDPILLEGYPAVNILGKIPIIYAHQEQTEFADVQPLIERLEKLLSNFADTNDYHGSPKIFVRGRLRGFTSKGEAGAIIEGEENTDVQYLTWSHAPESVRLEIETLLRMIYTLTQTPDISFESVKGLGNGASGKALRMLFLDAHLKVADHLEVFDEFLQRRTSVLKKYIGIFNHSLANIPLNVEQEVTPFMVDDYADKLEFVMTATGNKPVLSQKTGIKLAGLVDDTDTEYQNLQNEEALSVLEPTQ